MRPTLKPPPQVDAADLGQLDHEVERHPGAALPDFRVRARADVRVEAVDAQPVPFRQSLDLSQVLVPDPEARGGAAGVCALGRAAAQPRVHAHRNLTAPRATSELIQLMQRTGVEEHAAGDMRLEEAGRRLGGKLDTLGSEAGPQRPLDLEIARGVDMQAEIAEELEHAAAGIGLHGITERKAEGRREGEGLARGGLEGGAIVDVAGRAEAPAHVRRDVRGETRGSTKRFMGVHRATVYPNAWYWAKLRARRGPREPATRGVRGCTLSVAGDRERSMAKQIGPVPHA